jgi:hypothetical protein
VPSVRIGDTGPLGRGYAVSDPEYVYVESLPDLIEATEYAQQPAGRLVRVRIAVTDSGVEVLGDALRPITLEAVLAALGPETIEQMLCG